MRTRCGTAGSRYTIRMGVKDHVDKLKKEGSKDDKVAVASGAAITVIIVLIIVWAFFFFKSLSRGSQDVNLGAGAQDEFNPLNVTEAQRALQQQLQNPSNSDLQDARNDSGSTGQMQSQQMQIQGQETDQFGTPNSGY